VGLQILSLGGEGAIGQGFVAQQVFKHPDQSRLVLAPTQAELMIHFEVLSWILN